MNGYSLHRIFSPRSVAVLGMDSRETPLARTVFNSLRSAGFKGSLYPVCRDEKEVQGVAAYPGLETVGHPVDLAVVSDPVHELPAAVASCVRAGVAGIVILTGGPRAAELDQEILSQAGAAGVRLIGPRSWGLVNSWAHLHVGTAASPLVQGELALLSQSNALCATILDISLARRLGFSFIVGLGDMLDLDFADAIDYLANHSRVRAILLHVESVKNLRKFVSACRAAAQIKPLIVLKTDRHHAAASNGEPSAGPRLHENSLYEAVFQRAGIVRVDSVEELFDCAELVGRQPRPRGPKLAVIASGRSSATMAMDALVDCDLPAASFAAETVSSLDRVLPAAWNRENPVHIRAAVPPETYARSVQICLSAPEVDGILLILTPQFLADSAGAAATIRPALQGKSLPVLVAWMGADSVAAGRRLLCEAGIPVYETPGRAVRAFRHLVAYDRSLRALQEIPARVPGLPDFDRTAARGILDSALAAGCRTLTEIEALALLQAYGLPTVPTEAAGSAAEAVRAAARVGYPVVLKPVSRVVPDQSRPSWTRRELRNAREVERAFREIVDGVAGQAPGGETAVVAVQPQARGADLNLCLGSRLLPRFGPVLFCGEAGAWPEADADWGIGLPPLNRVLARRLIEGSRLFRRPLERRGRDVQALLPLLEEMLVRLSCLVTDFSQVQELTLDLVTFQGERAWVTGVQAQVRPAATPAPLHLIVSPYPNEYECQARTRGGLEICIRPIRPEDACLLQEMWSALSPRTIYYRFSRPLTELTPELLVRFTQIDYDREIALVALQAAGAGERMLAVSRLNGAPGAEVAEFSVVVADAWQGLGVGAELLRRLLVIAAEKRIRSVWGLIQRENTTMIDLARSLGFDITGDPQDPQVEAVLRLPGAGSSAART